MYNAGSKSALTRSFALASLLASPACVDSVDRADRVDELATLEAEVLLSDCPAETPAVLAPPANQSLAFVLTATGVQRYACNLTATGAMWSLVAPDATLFTLGLLAAGKHYAGPTWEATDGSTVLGQRVQGVTVDATAIPWLLLSGVGHGGSCLGTMADVTSIQRLATTGGLPPAAGCVAEALGATADVPYTAKYYFYKPSILPSALNTRCGATY